MSIDVKVDPSKVKGLFTSSTPTKVSVPLKLKVAKLCFDNNDLSDDKNVTAASSVGELARAGFIFIVDPPDDTVASAVTV